MKNKTEFLRLFARNLTSIIFFIAGYASSYGVNLFLARLLKASDYGDYSVALGVMSTCATLFLFGTDYAVLKFLPSYFENKSWDKAHGYLKHHAKLFFILSITFLLLGGAIAAFYLLKWNNNLGMLSGISLFHPVMLFLWAIPFLIIVFFVGNVIFSLDHVYIATILTRLVLPILLFIFFLVTLWMRNRLTIYTALLIYSAAILF